MDGLYLYCIREITENVSGFNTRGIDGKRDVFTIIHRELEAVISRVSLSKFTSEEIQRKAVEDLNWIKSPKKVTPDIEKRIVEIARQNPDWSQRKISDQLKHEGIYIGHAVVGKVLKQHQH